MPLRERFDRIRSHFAFRFTRIGFLILSGLLAVAIVTTLTIDLGDAGALPLRQLAERFGSRRIQRPIHIGSLSIRLFDGKFVIRDFVIDGVSPGDRPFLVAGRFDVSLTWAALIHREVLLDSVEMSDWRMTLEQWPNGRHNFPNFTAGGGGGRRSFVTTLSYVRSSGGEITFVDHGTPWNIIARNVDISVIKVIGYRGQA